MVPTQRYSSEVRRRQILDAAGALVLAQGYLPLSLEALAARVGVSKGLIYGHFQTQADLFNEIVAEEEAALEAAGLAAAMAHDDLMAAAQASADVYLRHVAVRGPLASFILRDVYMSGRVAPDVLRVRDRFLRGFGRRARRALALPAKEALAAVLLIQVIPEEMGRLVWQGDIPLERGLDLGRQLVTSAIEALEPSGQVPLADPR